MKETIEMFISDKKVAILGASPRKENWGRALMEELSKHDYTCIPVNPKYEEVEGQKCYASVSDLPEDIENVIIAVNPEISELVAKEFKGSKIKRVWFQRGMGKGSYSREAHELLKEEGIKVVYGFCPLMFIGGGGHKFHFWLRRTFGKVPAEFSMN